MKYTKPSIARAQLVAQMISKQSYCEMEGGIWYLGKGCELP